MGASTSWSLIIANDKISKSVNMSGHSMQIFKNMKKHYPFKKSAPMLGCLNRFFRIWVTHTWSACIIVHKWEDIYKSYIKWKSFWPVYLEAYSLSATWGGFHTAILMTGKWLFVNCFIHQLIVTMVIVYRCYTFIFNTALCTVCPAEL